MQSLLPDYLAKLRFDAQQLATLRALGEYRGKQQLFVAQSPEVLSDLRQVAVRQLDLDAGDRRDAHAEDGRRGGVGVRIVQHDHQRAGPLAGAPRVDVADHPRRAVVAAEETPCPMRRTAASP